jgi:5-methylcytosine-specific restriction endonuclease McrA
MKRQNFSEKTKRAALTRAGDTCEECKLPHLGRYHFDHEIPDGLTGKPTGSNCRLLCLACHLEKTKLDVARIAVAKRQEAMSLRVKADRQPIANRVKKARTTTKPPLPRRPLYVDIT